MKMLRQAPALGTALVAVLVFGACSQGTPPAPPATSAPTTLTEALSTPGATLEARFDATAAVGGGMNSSTTVSVDDIKTAFGSVAQIDRLRLTANSSPPGARAGEVASLSVIAQDGGGLLKELDQAAKQNLGDALLTAAGATWPNASVSLLVADPAGAGGQIIGSRPKGGPNTVIVM